MCTKAMFVFTHHVPVCAVCHCLPRPLSAAPQGCIELLKRSGVQMKGKTAAVVGRSNIVGLPVALLLQNEDATVTMVHSRTPNAGGGVVQSASTLGMLFSLLWLAAVQAR